VAHREPGAEEQDQAEQGVGGDEADLPEPGDLGVARELRRREDGLADKVESSRSLRFSFSPGKYI